MSFNSLYPRNTQKIEELVDEKAPLADLISEDDIAAEMRSKNVKVTN